MNATIQIARYTLFNPATEKYTFKYEKGCYEVPGIYLKPGYQIARGADSNSYIYDADGMGFGLTCQEAINQGIAYFEDEIEESDSNEVAPMGVITTAFSSVFYQEAALGCSAYQAIGDDWMSDEEVNAELLAINQEPISWD